MTSHASRLLTEYENKCENKCENKFKIKSNDTIQHKDNNYSKQLSRLDIEVKTRYKNILESVYNKKHMPLIDAYITDLKNDNLTWYYRNTLLSISVKEREMKYKDIIKTMDNKYKVCKSIKMSIINACYCQELNNINKMFVYTNRYIMCDYCNNK